MPRTYDENRLVPIDPTKKACAHNWVRLFLQDKPDEQNNWPDRSLSDAEIEGYLTSYAVGNKEEILYYRPHVSAANILVGEPERIRELRYDDFFKVLRRPEEIVKAWYDTGRAFDLLIPPELLPHDQGGLHRSNILEFESHF